MYKERQGKNMEIYNKNRDKNNGMHDEIREQNAKLKDAPLKDKWSYFKEYYLKTTLAIIAAVAVLAYLAYTMITAPRDTAFAAFFFNDTGDSSDKSLINEFIDYTGINTKKSECYIDATMNYSSDSTNYEDYIYVEKVMAVIASEELDVIVGDSDTIDYYGGLECFSDITTILPDDLMEKFKDKLYYAKVGESGELVPVGIYITDAPKIDEYHYYVDMEPILGFIVNSNSVDNAIEFLRYIYME
jgi:hypothetical protein